MLEISKPEELKWIKGELPDVHTVSKNCWILAWFVYGGEKPHYWRDGQSMGGGGPPYPEWDKLVSQFRRVTMVHPSGNELNPLRWCDNGGMPVGLEEEVAYYAWISKGTSI